ncbi:MAG: hypothetical protein CTY10_06590 [Methylotenera sp.]|nr:MAG: hypothetical protein CTY10_06590 [Methylotenera sp.]
MRLQILLALSLFSLTLQAETVKIETIQFTEKAKEWDFEPEISVPYVVANQHKVAKKINDYLYINLLGTLAPNKLSDGIHRKITDDDDDPIAGVTSMQSSVLLNNKKVLSLQLDSEFCGAYCEEYAQNYSFDLHTGRHLTLADLFTQEGLKHLHENFYQAHVLRIRQEIKRLEKKAPDTTDKNDAIIMYQSCLVDNARWHKERVASRNFREIEHFSIDAKGIIFTHGRCSNHAMRALDSIDKFRKSYTFQSLKPFLTSYAKYLLLDGDAQFEQPSEITGQVYYGSIGKAPITFLIDHKSHDKVIRALYFYDQYRQPIALSGMLNEWIEKKNQLNEAKIIVQWRSGVAVGEWRGNKVLPFKIAP